MNCIICGDPIVLQCSDDEPHRTSGEPVCRRCYFKELGDAVERYPIGRPVLKR